MMRREHHDDRCGVSITTIEMPLMALRTPSFNAAARPFFPNALALPRRTEEVNAGRNPAKIDVGALLSLRAKAAGGARRRRGEAPLSCARAGRRALNAEVRLGSDVPFAILSRNGG
eukprot:gene9766-1162_t